MKHISKSVWILSIVSLFADMASEMLYPVLPIYLKNIGFSVVLIGILEGVAEAVAGLSKGYFGKLSDSRGRRVPFVQAGYALSTLSKPLMAVFVWPLWVFFARTLDRFGKGIRIAARDALLSDEATAKTKGKVFGFHRSMDTLGAVLGPLLALVYLRWYPTDYRTLFFIAFVPGLLAIAASMLLRDKKGKQKQASVGVSLFSFVKYWKISHSSYKRLVIGLLVFALVNSSDAFLLLKAKESGLNDASVISLYIFYNLIFALCSFPLGILADRAGLKAIFVVGLILFSLSYSGIAFASDQILFYVFFFSYGLFSAATDGISKAWITNIVTREETATAIGTFTAFQSISTMIASTLTGVIWFRFGSATALVIASAISLFVAIYFVAFVPVRSVA
ncbi:MAG: MFS transporter [Bacteroidales bacterium]|nr:MFS transporter [Bacteroidales bacterium]